MNFSLYLIIFIILLSSTKTQITYETLIKNVVLFIDCGRGIIDTSVNQIPVFSSNIDYKEDIQGNELNACFLNSTMNSYIVADITTFTNISNFFLSFFLKPYEIDETNEIPLISLISLTNSIFFDIVTLFNDTIHFYFALDGVASLKINDFSTEKWYYICIKVSDRNITFYLNGESKINLTLHEIVNLDTKAFKYFFIGGNPLLEKFYYCFIDDIRIMNLTEIQMTDDQIYAFYKKLFCNEGYYYNISLESCKPCVDKYCINCDDGSYCLVCNNNFYLNDNMNMCLCQKENCKQCDDLGICVECIDGFSLNENLNCVLNNCDNFPFCSTCSKDKCIVCINKYKLNKNGKCILPSKAITFLIISYIIFVVIVWIGVFAFAKSKFFNIINK